MINITNQLEITNRNQYLEFDIYVNNIYLHVGRQVL